MTAPLDAAFERAIRVPVVEESQIGAARRRAAALGDALGLDDTERGRLGIIVTEAATNLVRHARDGVLLIQPVRGPRAGVEVISIDGGPGMRDPARCLQDGYSTGGTGGTGLGAIKRMSSEFDLDSKIGVGTIVVARIWRDHDATTHDAAEVMFGGVCTPIISEEHIGDGWSVARSGEAFTIMVADGLGHGIDAETSSRAAVETFLAAKSESPARIIERAHDALRGTRGAAVAVARVEGSEVRYAGVGNIAGSVIEDTSTRHMVSHPGIVGHQMSRVQEFNYPWSDRSLLVMATESGHSGGSTHIPASPDGIRHSSRRRSGATSAGAATTPRWSWRRAPRFVDDVTESSDELQRLRSELDARETELTRLRTELAETNSGVLALYAELETQAEAIRRASDLKSSFLSNVSHELRTPIASVINLARLLLDEEISGNLDDEQRRQIGYIARAGDALLELVNSLLDLARIEAGRMDVHVRPLLVADLLATLRGMFRPLVTRREVALVIDEPPPRLTMHSDEGRIAQILRNLVGNALKFTERGEIRVSTSVEGAWVTFVVRDTGIGIPEEHRDRVFREFEQVAGPLQAKARGVGLGLPLSRRLAELLGGTLVLESTPGAGSTFTLRLPVVLRNEQAEAAAAREAVGA